MALQTFRVGIWEEQSGYVEIEAESQEEAEDKAQEILSSEGVEGFPDFDCTHRDTHIV